MKKSMIFCFAVVCAIMALGCGGPSAEEQANLKLKTEQLEAATQAVDSTQWESEQTAYELDSLLHELSLN